MKTKQIKKEIEYLDELIIKALESRKKVTIFLCKDEEGGFGIKIDGKIVCRNMCWEVFEYKLDDIKIK